MEIVRSGTRASVTSIDLSNLYLSYFLSSYQQISLRCKRYLIVKLIRGIILAVAGLTALSCGNDDAEELFSMTQITEFEVRAGLNQVETHFFIPPVINSSYDDLLESTGFDSEMVSAVTPKFCELTTPFGDIDLDYLRTIEVRVFDPFDQERTFEVFYLDPVPQNSRGTIRPFPGLLNVKNILSNPSFGIEVRLIFSRPPPTTENMRLLMEFSAVK